ncbi:hypothetical protein ACB092_01G181100 [Castanea dentata]
MSCRQCLCFYFVVLRVCACMHICMYECGKDVPILSR